MTPAVADDAVSFSLFDPQRELSGVALVHELVRPRRVPFEQDGTAFRLRLPRPPVDRLEYLLERERRDGRVELGPDPSNGLLARGPFGPKSVVEFPGYTTPPWVGEGEAPSGELRELKLPSRLLRTTATALVWAAAGADATQPLPLLVVHDGPEYAEYSSLLQLLDYIAAAGEVPPFRAALIPPPLDRLQTYTASARYARTLTEEWLPLLGSATVAVGLGASMGALSLLHAHYARPDAFGGLVLQSGAFFRRRFDSHEARLDRFERVTRFVSRIGGGRGDVPPVPLVLTCGTGEENLANNRWLAETLAGRGWPLELVEHRDAHNWISWRDVLHPHLRDLMLRALDR